MRAAFIIVVCLVSLVLADQLIFKSKRQEFDGGTISEGFVRKGTLGEILRQSGLLSVSEKSEEFATADMCAKDSELKGFDYHNQLRLRLKIASRKATSILIRVGQPKADDPKIRIQDTLIEVDPKRLFYSIAFNGEVGMPINISATKVGQRTDSTILAMLIDGRFGRTHALLDENTLSSGHIVNAKNIALHRNGKVSKPLIINASNPRIILQNPDGLPDNLFKGAFPGKKRHGFCDYKAASIAKQNWTATGKLPEVKLTLSSQNLTGSDGLLENKRRKGRLSEVPATLEIKTESGQLLQQVGMRFHGGGPGRRKDINSYRIYARKDYGKGSIPHEAIFQDKREIDPRAIVFKYTYQAYFDKTHYYFNPFNHALALDIAEAIGAIVPSHGLVNLTINDKKEGVFLAMEHLSDRTIENWLGHTKFATVTYKKDNPFESRHLISRYMDKIKMLSGEASFTALKQHYNIDNVINSILLTAYIADDDFCQGMEMFDFQNEQIVSINWDLDHAFIKWDERKEDLEVLADRPGFDLLKPERSHLCSRSRVYSWVYSQSAEFRTQVRERFNYLLSNQLSEANINKLLAPYREVNRDYYQNNKAYAISDLERFARERPAILSKELDALEKRYQAVN